MSDNKSNYQKQSIFSRNARRLFSHQNQLNYFNQLQQIIPRPMQSNYRVLQSMNERRLNQSREFGKPNWDWTQVECILKTTESSRKSVQWQLAPSILLTNPTSTNSDPNVKLFIDTEKSLSYAPDLGWNWHKSWNLPNISIRLEIKDQATGQQLLTPKNIYAQIFAVKKNGDNDRPEKTVLLDVGIRGDSKMQMIDGQVYFSAMKFSSTTYNNEGQNFHLLIVIYIQQNQIEKPKVLTAVISPQIFVDSRRSARDYQQKKFNSFVQPFSTDQLDKQFIKRQNKSRTEQQIQIKNDPEGFYNYLTAPNIRHKVKHPIFLAIRFSNCVKILYNHEKLIEVINTEKQKESTQVNSRQLMQVLQKRLLKESQTKTVRQESVVGAIQEKLFLFVVENINDSLKRKKVMESIQALQSQSFGVVEDPKIVTSQFKLLNQLGSLSKIYKDNFQLLKQICRRYVPSDEQNSGEQSDEQYGGRSEQAKKLVKVNKIENGNEFTFNNQNVAKKSKTVNIVCQTIQTVDSKPVQGQVKNSQQEVKNERPIQGEPISSNRNQQQRQIKEEQQYHREINFKPVPQQNVGFRPIGGGLQPASTPNTITNQTNSFTMNIGSKKGSAFNNLRPTEPERNQVYNPEQQYNVNPNAGFNNYPAASPNNFGLPNLNLGLGSMNNLNNMGLFGANGISPGLLGGLNGLHGINPLNNLGVLPSMSGLNGLGNYGLSNGVGSIPGMSNLGVGGNLGSFGLQGLQPGMNSSNLNMNNLLRQPNNSFGNYQPAAQNNLNSQARSLQNLLCSNLLLSNWLTSVKANNQSLQQSIKGQKSEDESSSKPKQQGQDLLSDLTRYSPQQNQSMAYLLQQINLYRQLLNQVTYQNELLGRNMNQGQPMNPQNVGMNQIQEMMQSNNSLRYRGFHPIKENESKEPKQEHQD